MTVTLLKKFKDRNFVLLATESTGVQCVMTNSISALSKNISSLPKEEAVNFSEELSQYQIIEIKV